jgi:hypothetical protein
MRQSRTVFGIFAAATLGASSPAWAGEEIGSLPIPANKYAVRDTFLQSHPGAGVNEFNGRLERVYGPAFSHGQSAQESAQRFVIDQVGMWGIAPQDLAARGPFEDGRHLLPIMTDSVTGAAKFTGVYYSQERDGVPVFRGHLVALVRNDAAASYPMVLASSSLRDLGGFRVQAKQLGGMHEALTKRTILSQVGEAATLDQSQMVIWAGVDDIHAPPTLAYHTIADRNNPTTGYPERWLYITNALTGDLLYQESLVYDINVSGNVSGNATQGIAAWQCPNSPESVNTIPYARVAIGATTTFADVNGNFTITNGGAGPVTVTASLQGPYFITQNQASAGSTAAVSVNVTPPGPANLLFNTALTEATTAEVNVYRHANIVRDLVLAQNSSFPSIGTQANFPLNVNIALTCNAFYLNSTLNFYNAGGGCSNTGYSTVVYHEYGHNVVEKAGSGQGAYGEGMGDCISIIASDQPCLADGFSACGTCLRTANNSCQYAPGSCSTCGAASHECGNLISGCVWSVRNNLLATNPATYRSILSSLTVNSVLLHVGLSSITPSITTDFLTLDDDNGDISDGTPHYAEINSGFTAHGMAGPPLAPIKFTYPNGRPTYVAPQGGTTIRVVVVPLSGTPQPGTGKVFINSGGGFVQTNMTVVSPNVYDAVIPAIACGTQFKYYFSAQSTGAQTINSPGTAPAMFFSATSAIGVGPQVFGDDFQSNQGWTVTNSAGLVSGGWERGAPIQGCGRGNPSLDADNLTSGFCFLTGNNTGIDGNCDSDVDGGSTTLTSPIMNATVPVPVLSYARWFNNHGTSGSTQDDTMLVEFSTNGGSSWNALETIGPLTTSLVGDVNGGWVNKAISLSTIAGFSPTNQFRVRFIAQDAVTGSVVEAAIDNVKLQGLICQAGVIGDVTGDGLVNIDDLVSVITHWGVCSNCPSDVNHNGVVDIDDLVAVITHWS